MPQNNPPANNTPDSSGKLYITAAIIALALVGLMLYQHRWDTPPAKPDRLKERLPDFAAIQPVSQKKQVFFDYLRPFVRQENQRIQYDRAFLESLTNDVNQIDQHGNATLRKLQRLADKYQVKLNNIESAKRQLKQRIDTIPESLVLVQAANESAWGTSRFARDANNLFGMWCFKPGCGLVPNGRDANARHEVRVYPTPQASVVSYMRNLNAHHAYQEFRDIRSNLRRNGAEVTGVKLAHGLLNYSERREAYVEELISMIRQNKLE